MANKKTVKKAAPVKRVAPRVNVAVENVTPACPCGCRKGFGHFLKKLIIFIIIFALGFAACKFLCCDKHHGKFRGEFAKPEFVNGCLDTSKIKNPKKAQKIAMFASNADVDSNGCVTVEEFKAAKKEMFMAKKAAIKEKIDDEFFDNED